MISNWVVILISVGYLILLFLVAYFGEYRAKKGKSLLKNPYIYALSLAVYCTAWTYYGSVGNAAESGLNFLATYIGPTLLAPIWWLIFKKIIRISKVYRITTIADLISTRYGKSVALGRLVAIFCVLGIIPYISIQLKAISSSFQMVSGSNLVSSSDAAISGHIFNDYTLYITIGLAFFTILFGTRNIDATVKQEGMVTAIAFESILKLVAFLVVGFFITFVVFDGFSDIFSHVENDPSLSGLTTLDSNGGYSEWFWLNMLSMMAFMFLPRQFHVSIKENTSEKHLDKAIWLFPLYLLVINIFVIPIAFAGKVMFSGQSEVLSDTFVLAIPILLSQDFLAIFVYLGGFAAGTSMVIVSTIALSIMISNNLIFPYLVSNKQFTRFNKGNFSRFLLNIRRASILLVLLLSYAYYSLISFRFSIVSIGLISFVAVAQFAPAVIGGIFWKEGNKKGAISGLVAGFTIWFLFLVLPTIDQTGFISFLIQNDKLFNFIPLADGQAFGLPMNKIPASLFWSLLINTSLYVFLSLRFMQSSKERNQAEVFVDVFKYSKEFESTMVWKGTAYVQDIEELLTHFVGVRKTKEILKEYEYKYNLSLKKEDRADSKLVNSVERTLAGLIGSSSARLLISTTLKEEEISTKEVLDILKETQQIVIVNKQLKEKSQALEEVTKELFSSNEKLRKMDHTKDEFISTITHEMRTPITSIRAFSEILHDNSDISLGDKQQFLNTIIKETERMDRLISQVLDLEKFNSGKQEFHLEYLKINELILEAIQSVQTLLEQRGIELTTKLEESSEYIYGDNDRLIQVLLNLISNAIKFCDAKAGKIQIVSKQVEGNFVVEVIDNGKGIMKEIQHSIFDVFYQAPDQTRKKPKGSGLGLSICKKIIEYHHGKIWVESNEQHGSKFIFTLPAKLNKSLTEQQSYLNEENFNS
ncbi:GHKL domain-containing protein [Marivirga sp. S37H4]|uniref:histidine kinase n=1 Tax=Marivirga aurantiaca TaxID=2802615 RepID=A0A934X0B4_9BACT|nr:sensor histidine kinase [Marivirga aurantiaca]MBK6266553.1 GHKL domain-containing protein [Marivirga aurantiaca]